MAFCRMAPRSRVPVASAVLLNRVGLSGSSRRAKNCLDAGCVTRPLFWLSLDHHRDPDEHDLSELNPCVTKLNLLAMASSNHRTYLWLQVCSRRLRRTIA